MPKQLIASGVVEGVDGEPVNLQLDFNEEAILLGSFSGDKIIEFTAVNGSNVPTQAPFTVSVLINGVEDNSTIVVPFRYHWSNNQQPENPTIPKSGLGGVSSLSIKGKIRVDAITGAPGETGEAQTVEVAIDVADPIQA